MDKNSPDPVHCWLIWGKAFPAASKYLYARLEETGIDDTDFRILGALLNKGPLPVNTIGPRVYLTPGSISVAVDRLVERGLVSRVESPEDRRVRVVSLTCREIGEVVLHIDGNGFTPELRPLGHKISSQSGRLV